MKLLLDMNLPPRWVDVLAGAHLHAVHRSTVGAADAEDSEIMSFASDKDCVVVTHDLDFSAILAATGGEKPSVVQLRTDILSPDLIGDLVVRALRQM